MLALSGPFKLNAIYTFMFLGECLSVVVPIISFCLFENPIILDVGTSIIGILYVISFLA